ncbi:hypothetical protein B0J14DRAFT_114089 [Halenospora varia]|nr:hypothetical protein B0J14DRAFT_114089 [Halenospora varia]
MSKDLETLRKEILELRRALLYYEQHHRHCTLIRQPTPPPDQERAVGPEGDAAQLANTNHLHTTSALGDGLEIIFEAPSVDNVKQKPKKKTSQQAPRWKAVAEQLVDKVPDAKQWTTTKEDLGLGSINYSNTIISTISGARNDSHLNAFDTYHDLAATVTSGASSSSPDLIAIANAYAWITKGSQLKASFACLLRSFQELVFTSLCAVLERNGIEVALVDDAMRICISDSDPRNLKQLRYGAVWANRMIVDLAKAKDVWDFYRATEMVLLCGLSISKYSILAASSDSLAYMSGLLTTSKYTKQRPGIPQEAPFSIPAFIKVLVGDSLT